LLVPLFVNAAAGFSLSPVCFALAVFGITALDPSSILCFETSLFFPRRSMGTGSAASGGFNDESTETWDFACFGTDATDAADCALMSGSVSVILSFLETSSAGRFHVWLAA
jgi:hypothetical protein